MARNHHYCRATVMVGLSLVLVIESGCATGRPTIWMKVPSVRWSNKAHDTDEVTAQKEPAAEPAMAANVAVKTDPIEESSFADEPTSGRRMKSAITRPENRHDHPETRSHDGGLIAAASDPDDATAEAVSETQRSDSSMERLNAALTDDALQSQALPQRSLTALDDRIRVDSLLSRAKQLFEIGQLDQARQLAQTAQDLGESTQLDYSPDEERPIDLVHRIDGQLEASRLHDEPRSASDMTDSPTTPVELDATNPDPTNLVTKSGKPTIPAGKETSGIARKRRDWSTLFRREKKPIGVDTDPVAQNFKSADPATTIDLQNGDPHAGRTSESGVQDAIVMANRSVSLGAPESVTMSPASFAPDIAEAASVERDSMRSDGPVLFDAEIQDNRNRHDGAPAVIVDSSRQSLDSDVATIVPPDFDIVETAVPSHDVASRSDERPQHEAIDPDDTIHKSDWTYFYIGFGLCSLLAIGCYRRGTT